MVMVSRNLRKSVNLDFGILGHKIDGNNGLYG